MVKINDNNIVTVLLGGSAAILLLLTLCGALFVSLKFGASILTGGLLALLNFLWLLNAMKKVLQLPVASAGRFAQLRYIMRLAAMGIMLAILIGYVGIDIVGLIIGLSVLVVSITGLALYKLTFKGGW